MVRPTKPKELKPKAEDGEDSPASAPAGISGMKLIMVNAVITVLVCLLFVGSNYFIMQSSVNKMMQQMNGTAEGAGDQGEGGDQGSGGDQEEVEKGIILDLGEFILNLSDPSVKRFLKVNVALELSRKDTDPKAEGSSGGHGGEGVDPKKAFEKEMEDSVPAVRDAIISVLSSKTADELLSQEGKEQAKDQIKESVNGILGGEREVLRVSFGNFIIQ